MGVPAGKAQASCTDVLMRVGDGSPRRREAQPGSGRGDWRRGDDSVYEAEWRSAANTAFLKERMNTCPGNAPVQPSLAPGLAQGGERGHCKGNRERPISRRKATHSRAERTGTTGPARTRAWGERGAASSRRSRQRSQLLGCTLGTGAHLSSSRAVTQPQGSGEEGSAGADGHRRAWRVHTHTPAAAWPSSGP